MNQFVNDNGNEEFSLARVSFYEMLLRLKTECAYNVMNRYLILNNYEMVRNDEP